MFMQTEEFDFEEMHRLLAYRFNDSELRTLCLYLKVDYENLSGNGRTDKARELILFLMRNDRLNDLFRKGADFRPDINWQNIVQSNFSADNLILINGKTENFSQRNRQVFLHLLANILDIGMEEIYLSSDEANTNTVTLNLSYLARERIRKLPQTSRDLLKEIGVLVRELPPNNNEEKQSIFFANSALFKTSLYSKSKAMVNWDSDSHRLILAIEEVWSKPFAIQLQFANREEEKETVRRKIEKLENVQIIASGGLGKTFLLNKIYRELEQNQNYKSIWFDFADEDKNCIADRYEFLDSFYFKLSGKTLESIGTDESVKLNSIVREMANHSEQIVLFIDNADCANWKQLDWIRNIFLQELYVRGIRTPTVGSAQENIPEWAGISGKSPLFSTISLSGFTNFQVIKDILSNVVEVFGSPRALAIKNEIGENSWIERLDLMSLDILKISRGHPFVIAQLINYIHKNDGFLNATYCSNNREQIAVRVLDPIVGGRILPKIKGTNPVRQAFKSLCVFRYLWPSLIRKLCQTNIIGIWDEFSMTNRNFEFWWTAIQETSLIQDVNERLMYPISPIERQIIANVLEVEDIDIYYKRNAYARDIYEDLVYSEITDIIKRATYFVEMLFHMTQDGTRNPNSFQTAINKFKNTFDNVSNDSNEMYALIHKWIRYDNELKERVNDLMIDEQLYAQIVDDFVLDGYSG